VSPCPFCSIPANRTWIESEHAIAFAADAPTADGHIVVVPKQHVPSTHALPIAAQKGVWALVSEVRGRLRTGMVPDAGFKYRLCGWADRGRTGATHRGPRRSAPRGRSGAAGMRGVDQR
jgi:HIT domain